MAAKFTNSAGRHRHDFCYKKVVPRNSASVEARTVWEDYKKKHQREWKQQNDAAVEVWQKGGTQRSQIALNQVLELREDCPDLGWEDHRRDGMEWTAREEVGFEVGEGWLWTDEADNQHPCPRVH